MTRPICALRYLATLALLAGLLLSSTGVLAQDSEGTPVTSDPPTTQEEPPPPPPPPAPEPEVNEPPAVETEVPAQEPTDIPTEEPTGEPTDEPTGEPTDEPTTSDPTQPADDGTSGTPVAPGGTESPTAEPTKEDAVQAAALEEPQDTVAIPIQVTLCETDSGGDCGPGANVQIQVVANGGDPVTVTANSDGEATADVPEDALVILTVIPPDGYVPQGNGVVQLTAEDGSSATFTLVSEPEMGQLQISNGRCPTIGEPRTEFIVAGPLMIQAASEGCAGHAGATFTITGGNLGSPMSVTTDGNGDWMGYLAAGTYEVANNGGSTTLTVENGRVTLVIVVDFIPGPTGTLVIQRWHCTVGDQDSTVITVTSNGDDGPPHESCTASNRTVRIVPVDGDGVAPLIVELGDDGLTSINLAEGAYIIEDLQTGETSQVEVSAAGTVMAVVTHTVTTGSISGVIHWCADGNSRQQDPSNPAYWQTNCTAGAAGASVALLGSGGQAISSTTTTGDGAFGFSSVPPGSYVLSYADGCAQFVGGADARGAIVVTAGSTTTVTGYACAEATNNPPGGDPPGEDPPVNGGGGTNPPANGGQQSGGNLSGGLGTSVGGVSNTQSVGSGSGSELHSVTALPSTGVGSDQPAVPIMQWLAFLASALIVAGMAQAVRRRGHEAARVSK